MWLRTDRAAAVVSVGCNGRPRLHAVELQLLVTEGQVLAVHGDGLFSMSTGDLQHFQLNFVDIVSNL